MKTTINTILLTVIATAAIIIAVFFGITVFHSNEPVPTQWEYSWKAIRDIDPTVPGVGSFEDYNKWIGEGWEPMLKLDTKDRYLMRRPKPTQ